MDNSLLDAIIYSTTNAVMANYKENYLHSGSAGGFLGFWENAEQNIYDAFYKYLWTYVAIFTEISSWSFLCCLSTIVFCERVYFTAFTRLILEFFQVYYCAA